MRLKVPTGVSGQFYVSYSFCGYLCVPLGIVNRMGPWPDDDGGSDVAGSGIGGWISGSCWYDKHKERRDKFLMNHPEWAIVYVRSMDRHEASKGDTETKLVILTDKSLGRLMDRLEDKYGDQDQEASNQA
jgi:hypothetical protein